MATEKKKRVVTLVDVNESRTPKQKAVMERIAKDGVCPFCEENLGTYHHQPVFFKNKSWLVTRNDTPYEGSRTHLLIICRRHVTNVDELDQRQWASLGKAIIWAKKKFSIKGGAFLMRFGDMGFNGASVQHLHAHIIVGVKKSKKTESLKVKVGHKTKKA